MSPICLFVYKRYDTTKQMLESLKSCPECSESDLYVFMDAARSEKDIEEVVKVRSLFDGLDGFRHIETFPADTNKGLARSVIEGVSYVLQKHDDIIVLEDDLVVAPDFLSFMNEALKVYKNRSDIWSISGYTPNLEDIDQNKSNGVFLVPRAQCWGWATWRDRWMKVDWEVGDFEEIAKRKVLQDNFNRGGDDLFRTLKMERRGRIESWAVRWAYAAAKNNMFTVNPMQSKVQNIGIESSETHSSWNGSKHHVDLNSLPTVIDPDVHFDATIASAFKRHHDLGLISRIGYFMRLNNLGYAFIKRIVKVFK